jgi:hypothetical protein
VYLYLLPYFIRSDEKGIEIAAEKTGQDIR